MKTEKLIRTGRYLAYEDGTPFFYLGDTAWELFHRLNKEDAEHFLKERSRQGFTAIQAVALAEMDGLLVPNRYGRIPFKIVNDLPDSDQPDLDGEYSYWDHVDYIIKTAEKYSLYISLLPTWGDKFNRIWGKGPEIFNPENAYRYAKWLAERYKNAPNIIWMLGGDRPLDTPVHRQVIDAMAAAIRDAGDDHLITFHPCGSSCSTKWVGDADYIDFHSSQSGHSSWESWRTYEFMEELAANTDRPFLDSEPRYEDHPSNFNDRYGYYWDADDIRVNAFWNVLCGTCGHTYGNHCIWSMTTEPTAYFPYSWKQALVHPGAEMIHIVKDLRLSRDYFSLKSCQELLVGENYYGMGHLAAALGNGYAYVYSPLGLPFTVDISAAGFKGLIKASWFDPRTGESRVITMLPNSGKNTFAPPSSGKGNDWLLILDDIVL